MRKADIATVVRIALVPLIVYAVTLKLNPIIPVTVFIVALVLDGVDGFLALNETSKRRIGISTYIRYALGDDSAGALIKEYKPKVAEEASWGPRMDVAGDRIVEYSLWALFVYVKVIPFFVLLLIIAMHSLADALMGSKGTSTKAKTRFAEMVYTSKWSRLVANVLKALAFSYLMLVYIAGWNLYVGYALAGALVVFIMIRGAAEICESVA
jgi:phosphatidylglycerophosphate synthase